MQSTFIYGLKQILKMSKPMIKKIVKTILRKKNIKRNQELILNIYEPIRKKELEKLEIVSLDRYALSFDSLRWSLVDNRIILNGFGLVRDKLYELISTFIVQSKSKKVIELGSGNGHNLLLMASKFKELEFIGIEISPASVYLANQAAKKFGINNVNFVEGDLGNPQTYESYLESKNAIFSVHALEEMPRIYKIVLNLLNSKAIENILLLEPIYLFSISRFTLDIARLMRIYIKDRLFGLLTFTKKNLGKNYIVKVVDLSSGANPLNPTTLVRLQRKSISPKSKPANQL